MAIRTSLNVSLTPQLEKFVKSRVSNGGYQTASEVVREGLRLLQRQERERESTLKTLKRRLDRGAAQADRGEFVDPDHLLRKIETVKKSRAAVPMAD